MAQQYFHIRLTHNVGNPKYAQYMKERTVTHLMVTENEETADKQAHHHCHFVSIKTNSQSLRREFLKWFPEIAGNGSYALKDGTGKKPANARGFVYVAKGTGPDWDTQKPNVVSTSFSDDEVKEFHRQYWNHHDRIIVNTADLSHVGDAKQQLQDIAKAERRKRPTWTQSVISEIRIQHPDHGYDYQDHLDRKYLVDKILSRMGEGGKALDETVFRRIFFAVYNGLKKTPKAHGEFRQKFYQCIDK